MVKTTKYVRKPFEVEAVRVTAENMVELAGWCHGEIMMDQSGKFIKVRVVRVLNERQTKAYEGDWILYAGTGFKVYTNKAFRKTFELPTGPIADAMTQATKQAPPGTMN